jgi:hypothetical protein
MMQCMQTVVADSTQSGKQPGFVAARVHALMPGTWPADPQPITITAEDIAAIAAAYNPQKYQAPVVIGHPETDSPAWGWVLDASAELDGLWLDVELLPEMADLVREGRYKAVSVSLWMPDAPGNPTPGVWSLKHLGYLGAVPPAVKGLAPTQLQAADTDERTIIITSEASHGAEQQQKEIMTMAETKNDGDAVQLAERERQIAEREAAIARRERELKRATYAQEIDAHVAAGRILPAEKSDLVELMERLDGAATVTLAEGGERPALDLLRDFLARLPSRVTLGEHAKAQQNSESVVMPSVPQGYKLSERGLMLHSRALEYMAAHAGTDYLTAVRAVERTIQ